MMHRTESRPLKTRCLELEPGRERYDTGRECAGWKANGRSIRYRVGSRIKLDPGIHPVELRVVERVVRLNLKPQEAPFSAQRNVLGHRQVEVGHVRISESSGATALVTYRGRPDDRVVRPGSQSRHGICRWVEESAREDVGQRIADHLTTHNNVRRASVTARDGCRTRSEAATRIKRRAALDGSDSGESPVVGHDPQHLYAILLRDVGIPVGVVDLEIVAPVCARPAVIPSLVVGSGLVVSGGAQCFGESVRQAKYHAVRKALFQDGGESIVVTVPNQRILGDGAVPRVLRSFENTANVGA